MGYVDFLNYIKEPKKRLTIMMKFTILRQILSGYRMAIKAILTEQNIL